MHDIGGLTAGETAAAGKFYVALAGGRRAVARFDEDSLVFMLGDGIHQVLAKDQPNRRSGDPVRGRSTFCRPLFSRV